VVVTSPKVGRFVGDNHNERDDNIITFDFHSSLQFCQLLFPSPKPTFPICIFLHKETSTAREWRTTFVCGNLQPRTANILETTSRSIMGAVHVLSPC
jgi:hypothetical protein